MARPHAIQLDIDESLRPLILKTFEHHASPFVGHYLISTTNSTKTVSRDSPKNPLKPYSEKSEFRLATNRDKKHFPLSASSTIIHEFDCAAKQ
jgi:hypothetical protein